MESYILIGIPENGQRSFSSKIWSWISNFASHSIDFMSSPAARAHLQLMTSTLMTLGDLIYSTIRMYTHLYSLSPWSFAVVHCTGNRRLEETARERQHVRNSLSLSCICICKFIIHVLDILYRRHVEPVFLSLLSVNEIENRRFKLTSTIRGRMLGAYVIPSSSRLFA